jgi:hypothetical protein
MDRGLDIFAPLETQTGTQLNVNPLNHEKTF